MSEQNERIHEKIFLGQICRLTGKTENKRNTKDFRSFFISIITQEGIFKPQVKILRQIFELEI